MFTTSAELTPVLHEPLRCAETRIERVDLPDGFLHVSRTGAGPVLLAMHGGLGWDHQYLRVALDPLAACVEVVYYDHRGNGRSTRPGWWEGVTNGTWVDDAEALRVCVGAESVLLFGHSYGGHLAQEYALRYPERVTGLILSGTVPAFDFTDQAIAMAQARATPAQFEALLGGLAGPVADDAAFEHLMRAVLPLYLHAPERAGEVFPQETRWSAAAFNRGFFGCLPQFDTSDRLGELRFPTLILSGDDDWIAPLSAGAERLHRGIAGSELVIFERCGHFPWIEAPDGFYAALRSWIERLKRPSEGEAR